MTDIKDFLESDFFDKNALREPIYRLKRINVSQKRFYLDLETGVAYPSITTIISSVLQPGYGLIKWISENGQRRAELLKEQAASYGTLMHIMIAKLLIDKKIEIGNNFESIQEKIDKYINENKIEFETSDWADRLTNDLYAFNQFVIDKEFIPIAIEVPLKSDIYGFSGTLDITGELTFNKKRVTALIDLKSGRHGFYESNELQLALGKLVWDENFPERPIEMLFNWSPKDWNGGKPTYNFTNQTSKIPLKIIEKYIDIFYFKQGKSSIPKKIFNHEINLGKISDQEIYLKEIPLWEKKLVE